MWIQSDRITLVSRRRRFANCRAASVGIHSDITALFVDGDVLHLARTGTGGLAFALVRDDELVLGVGALTSLTSLSSVGVRCERVIDPAAGSGTEREVIPRGELPVAVTILGASHWFSGKETGLLGEYEVRSIHGFKQGTVPDIDESLVIVHTKHFPVVAASEAASPLIRGLEMVDWDARS